MQREGGEWVVRLPLSPGVYHYAFRAANGEWFVPPSTPGRRDDGMGGYRRGAGGELMDARLDRRRPMRPTMPTVIARVLEGEKQQFEHLVQPISAAAVSSRRGDGPRPRRGGRHGAGRVRARIREPEAVSGPFALPCVAVSDAAQPVPGPSERGQPAERPPRRCGRTAARRGGRLRVRSPSATSCGRGIRRALAQLPPALREAFVMHYVDGMPYETMAELLDASVSALKMRALRAREALRSALRRGRCDGRAACVVLVSDAMNGCEGAWFREVMMRYGIAVAIVAMALSGAARVNAQAPAAAGADQHGACSRAAGRDSCRAAGKQDCRGQGQGRVAWSGSPRPSSGGRRRSSGPARRCAARRMPRPASRWVPTPSSRASAKRC